MSDDPVDPERKSPELDAEAARFEFRNRASREPDERELPDWVERELPEPVADAAADPPAETPRATTAPAEKASWRARLSGVGALVWLLLLVSVVAVVMTYSSWHSADHDPDRNRAALRDDALIQGTKDVETMTSMDHRDVDAGIKAWQAVSTGVLHDQLVATTDDEKRLLAQQGKIATGHVSEAALTELTSHTATMIVAVEVTVRGDDASKKPTVKRNRFSADLVLVDGQWKIESLQQVAVNM